MVLALQIVLAACFVGIAVDMFIDINKNHKGECKNAGAKKWAQGMFVGIIANPRLRLLCSFYLPLQDL